MPRSATIQVLRATTAQIAAGLSPTIQEGEFVLEFSDGTYATPVALWVGGPAGTYNQVWPASGGGGGGAPTTADYLVKTANGSLSAERVVGDTATVVADWSAAGAVGFNVPDNAITYAKLQDVTATDRLLGRASAGAGDVEEIPCTAFARTVLDDADAAAVRATIGAGTSSFSGAYADLTGKPTLGEIASASLPDPNADRIVFWDDSAGAFAFLSLGTNLTLTGTTLDAAGGGVTDGDKGDITVSSSGAAWAIDSGAVSNAKLANMASARIKGRASVGSGVVEDLTATEVRTILGLGQTLYSQSLSDQGPGFSSDTYLGSSAVNVPAGAIKAGTRWLFRFNVTKTAAGTAAPVITVRWGTNGSAADPGIATFTFNAQTAVADEGLFELFLTFRTVGSGAGGSVKGYGCLAHRLATTGLSTAGANQIVESSSTTFDSTPNQNLGVSVNAGLNAAWTVKLVQATLENLNF